jgi:hypothetical protein
VRDVIVTAQDLPEAFDSVKNLVRSAPRYERWTFVALRPAKGFMFKTEADGITLDASTLMFDPTRSESRPTELGVIVYVPGALRMDDRLAGMVERALSTGIGEELFSIVKSIGVRAGFGEEGSLPIKDLGPYIAWHLRRNS